MNYRFRSKISYLFKARHRKGHGIHSPFLFRLITCVIENDGFFTAYPLLDAAEVNVRNMISILEVDSNSGMSALSNDVHAPLQPKLHLLPPRFNKLLFRLVNDGSPRKISFYGNTFGVTLMALALADRRIQLEAQVANSQARTFCRRLVEVYELGNVVIKETVPVADSDFVVVQNPQDPESCGSVLDQILGQHNFEGWIVLIGIHQSAEMEAVWDRSRSLRQVRISLDLFDIGVFVCSKGLQKEEFVVRF